MTPTDGPGVFPEGRVPLGKIARVTALLVTLMVTCLIVSVTVRYMRAWRQYRSMESTLSSVLQRGTPKQEILRALSLHGYEYLDWEPPPSLDPESFPPEVAVKVAVYTGPLFLEQQQLYLALRFNNDKALTRWHSWTQGGL